MKLCVRSDLLQVRHWAKGFVARSLEEPGLSNPRKLGCCGCAVWLAQTDRQTDRPHAHTRTHSLMQCRQSLQVDYAHRSRIAPNHTMTHVLNWALREAEEQ